ncbi:MAG: hypothetical protein OHK0023_00850 [Anaerolineae bacterium]
MLALRRLSAQWRSLLTIIAGVLLSAAVGALIPLYLTAVAQVSMVERFSQLPPEEVHLSANLAAIPRQIAPQRLPDLAQSYDDRARRLAEQHFSQPFPDWLNQMNFFAETSALAINPSPENGDSRIPDPTLRTYLSYYEGWERAIALVDGRLPTDPPQSADADIEVVIPLEAATLQNIPLNTVLILDQGGPRGGWETSKNIRAAVVGFAALPEPLSPLQRAYFMSPSPLRYTETRGEFQAEFSALATQAAIWRIASDFIPDTPARFGWRLTFDHTRLPFDRSPEARAALIAFDNALVGGFSEVPETGLNLQLSRFTKLVDLQIRSDQNVDLGVLYAYEQSVRSLDAPFTLLLLQMGALVIFFLLVTAALVRRGERRELAMLQSRGAADQALVTVRGFEAFVLCVLGAVLAPFLAQAALIAITPFFANYPNLPLNLTPQVFLFSAMAAFVAFWALLSTLRPVLKQPLISAGGVAHRAERQAWWQRYYVDVLLAVLGIAALLRLVARETPLFTTTAGVRTTDPFLLLAPALLFLGLGSVLLRVFPLLAGAASRVFAAARGVTGALAAWQLSREPVHYGRITFLLALAIGIGWFSTSFRATVARSQNDQSQYAVGTDARMKERDLRLNVARSRPDEVYTAVPNVAAVTRTWRLPVINFETDASRAAVNTHLLAVDSATFEQAVYWREDLGTLRLPNQKVDLPVVGAELPFVPQKLNLWAKFDVWDGFKHIPDLDRLQRRTTLYARLQDAAGAWMVLPFTIVEVEYQRTDSLQPGIGGGGSFTTNGWAWLEADFSRLSYTPVPPVRLTSVYWRHRGRAQTERFLRLTLASLTATDQRGSTESLDMLYRGSWEFAYDSGAQTQGNSTSDVQDGRRGLGTMWDQFAEAGVLGAVLNYPALESVSLIPSLSLVEQLGLQPGQTLTVRNVVGVDVPFSIQIPPNPTVEEPNLGIGYFPSLFDSFQRDGQFFADRKYYPFAVAERDTLLYALNRRPSATLYPDEVWLKLNNGAEVAALLETLRPADGAIAFTNVQSLGGALETLQTDPLSRGLLGLMFTQFIVALALSLVGLLTYAALTAGSRRAEFGVLRALGLPSGKVIGQLASELLFVIGLGVLIGAALGMILSNQVVPRLAQDASGSGAQIVPPFIVQVESAALLQYGAIIAAVLALVLLVSLWLVRRLSLSQSLRLGED